MDIGLSHWQILQQRKQQNRLPHALLLVGLDEPTKNEFAEEFAASVLCEKPDNLTGKKCGLCRHCHLNEIHAHPDWLHVQPEEAGQKIKIDQIRDMIHFINQTPLLNEYRIVIIRPAEAMNINAANALLKTLEEPTPRVLFLLISERQGRLPLTIVSRCQRLVFSGKETGHADELQAELFKMLYELSQQKQDPLQIAAQWQDKKLELILKAWMSCVLDLLRFKLTKGLAQLSLADSGSMAAVLTSHITINSLLQYDSYLKKIVSYLLSAVNLNSVLVIEDLFIRWVQLCK